MSASSRLRFVSSRLALLTHHVAVLRHEGGCDSKPTHSCHSRRAGLISS